MTVELVILAPVLVALALLVVYLGRAGGSVQQVRHAADVGARAASIVARPSMERTAIAAAEQDLATNGLNCASTSVAVTVAPLQPLSSVTVAVSCTLETRGLALLGTRARTVSATSTEVIDRHRGS